MSQSGWFMVRCLAGVAPWLALQLAATPGRAAEASPTSSRLTVAVATFEDQTGDPQADHWRHTLPRLLHEELAEVKAVRPLPRGASEFARRQLGIEPGGPLSAVQARRLGELIEARRVVWGSYRREGERWAASVRVLNVASGKTSGELKAAAADWLGVRDKLVSQILAELGVSPSRKERLQLGRHPTKSAAALAHYSRAYALQVEHKPWPDQEAAMRKALEADPKYAEAHFGLGAILGSQGRFDAAGVALRQAQQLKPDLPEVHLALGILFLFQEKSAEAEKELREASRLGPENAEVLMRLGELRMAQDKVDEALAFWKEAQRLDATSGVIHAHLGEAYARKGQRALALLELKDAERFDPETAGVRQIICRGYDDLHDTHAALEHIEKFVAMARKLGGNPALVSRFEQRARTLKVRLTPHAVQAAMPKVYSEESLQAALRERLSAAELKLVTNPMAGSPEMKRVADTLTLGARDELDKAQKLFDAVARHLDTGPGGSRTAQEVFAEWNNPKISFRCQEYARFYVALARAAGLTAFFTLVDKTHEGKLAPHACACVFANGQGWLADPTYRWFGVPHQDFKVVDDLEALVVHLHQQNGDLPRLRLAVKLQPDSVLAQFNLAMGLMADRRLNEARLVVGTAARLEPNSWRTHCVQGYLAGWERRWPEAIEHLRRAVFLNPDGDKAHFFLAEALRMSGKLREAREEYRAYLRSQSEPDFTEPARRALAQINEKLGGE